MPNAIYDKYYKKAHYFGDPYPGLQEFFKAYEPKGNLLDLGCGQGRDALFLGRLGYKVKGIDISQVGINQMNKAANEENFKKCLIIWMSSGKFYVITIPNILSQMQSTICILFKKYKETVRTVIPISENRSFHCLVYL